MALQIDVVSDVVCPWCFVGKRKLARAPELYREKNPDAGEPQVRWHPFQLDPDLPEARGDIRAADQRSRRIGVERVPFFIFNLRVALSGAHDPEVLLSAMQDAEQKTSEAEPGA